MPGIHDLIQTRWSPRAFSGREVSNEDLKTVLEAAHLAASCYNEQPWRFLVARKSDGEEHQKMLSVLVPFNQNWAKTAPVLLVTVGKKAFSHNQAPNRYALHDAGAALATLFLQANALGLHAHGMGGIDFEKARTVLEIPEDYQVGAAAALGYLGEEEPAKRTRKPLDEVVYGAAWGQPLKF